MESPCPGGSPGSTCVMSSPASTRTSASVSPRVAERMQEYSTSPQGVRRPAVGAGGPSEPLLPPSEMAAEIDQYMKAKLKYHRALGRHHRFSPHSSGARDSLIDLVHPPAHVLPPSFFMRPPWQPEGQQGSVGFVFTVCSTMMGSTLLCLPWGFQNAGLATGAVVTCCTGLCSFYTSALILRWGAPGAAPGYSDFGDLCEAYLGRWAKHVANVTSIAIISGALACYHVLIATNFQAVIASAAHILDVPASFLCCGSGDHRYATLSAIAGFSLLPLLFIRDIAKLAALGSYGVVAIFYNVVLLVGSALLDIRGVAGTAAPAGGLKLLGGAGSVGSFVGMMGLSLFVHSSLLPIASNHVHSRTAPAIVRRDLGIAYALSTLLYLIVGVFPCVAFELGHGTLPKYAGQALPQNALMAFPELSVSALVGRALFGVQCGLVYPILAAIMRRQLFCGCFSVESPGPAAVALYNVVLAASTMLIATLYPYPGAVVGYVGAYTAVVYILALPLLVHLRALKKAGRQTCLASAGNLLLGAVGTIMVLLQFFL